MSEEDKIIEFTDKCPNCNGRMAKGNKFCCIKCYKEANNDI